ncbi:MAG: cellobiose phosphorylase [Acholeplasmatales bacterium]|nr:MAG: cellobiose phosphorylase [Acholeplasmatales bacterium]
MTAYDCRTGTFNMEDFQSKNPFANFLPGVAGKMGIPLWVFYVNRGQGVAGFGLNNKNHPIMTFTPANKAYEQVSTIGFRTFIKVNGQTYEPFGAAGVHPQTMHVRHANFAITETNQALGLKTTVTYFGLPNQPIAALVRTVTLENIGDTTRDIELLDGLPELLPSGIQNAAFKSTSNLLASWMDVKHLEEDCAYYVLRASTDDSSEVSDVEHGTFYVAFDDTKRIRPLIDMRTVFGQETAKRYPKVFYETEFDRFLTQPQIAANKVPGAFVPLKKQLVPGASVTLHALIGHASRYETLRKTLENIAHAKAIEKAKADMEMLIASLLEDVHTETALPLFDAYVKQNYLDNLLRGGYPEKIGDTIYHLYSRRHGDLERDYNFFSLAPEYYSQGGGNFRDVCQNRRLDTFINPAVGRFNIRFFASLIQLDGYNPLVVNGMRFVLKNGAKAILEQHFKDDAMRLLEFLQHPFTPGTIVNFVEKEQLQTTTAPEQYLADIIRVAEPRIHAQFGEGYWIDHFTYILDLIDAYRAIFPDRMENVLFDDDDYLTYDAPVTVKPQSEKIVKTPDGRIRQYGSLRHFDHEKIKRLNMDPYQENWVNMAGVPYRTNLYAKLLVLVMNKHAQLDPDGIGIEMEAEKPGWNDAMNGLPGLLGSGVSETIELWRLVSFLKNHPPSRKLILPREVMTFFEGLATFGNYEARVSLREQYRDQIRFGLAGETCSLEPDHLAGYLKQLHESLTTTLRDLTDQTHHLPPTFLTYTVSEHAPRPTPASATHKQYPAVKPIQYDRHALPAFLEAPARLLKSGLLKEKAQAIHTAVTASDIYDTVLKMYKTSGPLEQETHEIGRIHAFTKGWLERESNFLHMTYKYLYGLLRAGLYDAFYEAIDTNFVCFMDPAVYGRNPLENSSFIAPSNNPDPAIHGQGFFARLSGSTVEVLSMWAVMMTGGNPFRVEEDVLVLRFEPRLHTRFFKPDGTLSFTFLKTIRVTYVNASRDSTYTRCDIDRIAVTRQGETTMILGDALKGALAEDIRDGLYDSITVYMNEKK